MKKALVILLCALAVFAIVSCKQDPPKPETFKVTFDSKGGSTVATANVEKDAKVEKPENPIKMGNIFYNWYTEETLENLYDFETPVTADITLYAKWIPTPANEVEAIKLTSTRSSDGWQLQWLFDAQIKEGDVISFKYKSNREFKSYTIRKMTGDKATSGKLADGVALVEDTPDADGWHTFTYTVAGTTASTDIGIGVRLETKDGNTAVNDQLYIKEISYKTAEATKNLTIEEANLYYGCEPILEKSFIRLVATKGTDGVDDYKYSQDKFTLYWNPNVQVNPGDVLTLTFKAKRNDPLTEGRDFTYSLRDAKKWFSEVGKGDKEYPQFWSTMSDPDLEGWITVTYVFPEASAPTKEVITYPATFRVDFRDTKIASPSEGREADIVYLRSATITTKDPEDPSKTITTALVLDKERVAGAYACPTVEEFFFPAK